MLDDILKDVSGNWEEIVERKLYENDIQRYEKFVSLLDGLVALNKANRKKFVERNYSNIDYMVGKMFYFKEFCTIKLDIGRQVGKTEYIIRNFKNNHLIIVDNNLTKRYILRRIGKELDEFQKVITIDDLKNITFGNRYNFNTIWVNDASYIMNSRNTDFLYAIYGNNKDQTFIFLG